MKNERVYAAIDVAAAAQNLVHIKQKVNGAKIMAVVKADAYGHGAMEMAKVFSQHGADAFAVAEPEEGIALRKAGIKQPILLLSGVLEEAVEEVLQWQLTPAVFSHEIAKKISYFAAKSGVDTPIHIKIDTGMHRVGFLTDDAGVKEVVEISKMPNIKLEGIFTHFASADEKDKAFTIIQKNRFLWFISQLKKEGVFIPVKHCANSAGILDFDDLYFDMCRAGIILYGIYPSAEVEKKQLELQPVMSWVSKVSHIKTLKEGEPVGYGRTYFTTKISRIATVPVGYGDGFLRSFGKNGRVLLRGSFAPIVGRICMDQFMIDITDIPLASVGDEVVLLGRQKDQVLPIEELAQRADTIPYEVLCCVGKRVPRLYIPDDSK